VAEVDTTRQVEAIVRAVASAGKALKLYPPTSPIPRETIEIAISELAVFLDVSPLLSLCVAREGIQWSGAPVGGGTPGVADLAGELREHGLAEVDFLPGCSVDDLVGFLGVIGREPGDVRRGGGASAILVADGIEGIRVTDVHLTVIEEVLPAADEDIELFLRSLATDADKLAAWLAAASAGDAGTFEEGLADLAHAVGSDGMSELARTLASAFLQQESDGKDALLGLALEPGTVRELAAGMFGHLDSPDIASALSGGLFGGNMLSLSNALVNLPLAERMRHVYADVRKLLPGYDHSDKELSFLDHMMEVRAQKQPQAALVDTDQAYRSAASAMQVSDEEVAALRSQTSSSAEKSTVSGVNIMLALLDQQTDFELYAEGVDHLAVMVPRLVQNGQLELALKVVTELAARESRAEQPWPDLTDRLRSALATALGRETMAGLVQTAISDGSRIPMVREFLRHADESSVRCLAEEAVAQKSEGLAIAEEVLGKRLVDLLVTTTANAQWFQLEPIVERLARESDARAIQAIDSILERPDEQSRREAAQGLAASGGPGASKLLGKLMRDPSSEVAMIAIRAVAKHDMPNGALLLSERLDELDVDGKDFLLAREAIGSLARLSDPMAVEVLGKLGGRRALIKRGHFVEIQELVRQALEVQKSKGGTR